VPCACVRSDYVTGAAPPSKGGASGLGLATARALAAKGATKQRCLWASTSAKNPAYRDVVYVEELVKRAGSVFVSTAYTAAA